MRCVKAFCVIKNMKMKQTGKNQAHNNHDFPLTFGFVKMQKKNKKNENPYKLAYVCVCVCVTNDELIDKKRKTGPNSIFMRQHRFVSFYTQNTDCWRQENENEQQQIKQRNIKQNRTTIRAITNMKPLTMKKKNSIAFYLCLSNIVCCGGDFVPFRSTCDFRLVSCKAEQLTKEFAEHNIALFFYIA